MRHEGARPLLSCKGSCANARSDACGSAARRPTAPSSAADVGAARRTLRRAAFGGAPRLAVRYPMGSSFSISACRAASFCLFRSAMTTCPTFSIAVRCSAVRLTHSCVPAS